MADKFDLDATILREHAEEMARLEKVSEEIQSGIRPCNGCDKCGRPVPFGNDAAVLDGYHGSFASLFATPRHLLPVVENGETVCEGSPSRAQYLPGQPKDKRLSYKYNPEYEQELREAYARMQHDAMARNADVN